MFYCAAQIYNIEVFIFTVACCFCFKLLLSIFCIIVQNSINKPILLLRVSKAQLWRFPQLGHCRHAGKALLEIVGKLGKTVGHVCL